MAHSSTSPSSSSSSSSSLLSTRAFIQPVLLRSCHWSGTSVSAGHHQNSCPLTCHLRRSFSNPNSGSLNSHQKDKPSLQSSIYSHSNTNASSSSPSSPSSSDRHLHQLPHPFIRPPQPDPVHEPEQFQLKWHLKRIVRPARIAFATMGAIVGTLSQVPQPSSSSFGFQSAQARSSSTTTSDQQKSSATVRYDGKQEMDSREKAMSLMLTGGTFAVLGIWAWKQNRRDDELEEVRIKEEVERLEKLRAEFLDVDEDDDSLDDEDLLASLKQRLSDSDDDEDKGTDKDGTLIENEGVDQNDSEQLGESEDDDDDDDNKKSQQLSDSSVESNGESNGTTDPNANKKQSSPTDADSVDMLRRMWEATDDDSKKEKDNKS